MASQLDRDLIEHARQQLGVAAGRLVSEGLGPERAARVAIHETQALFPHDWQLGVQGDDDDEAVEVWEVNHKYPQPIARVSRTPAPTMLTPIQRQHLAIIEAHGGGVRRSAFGGWLDGVRGLRLSVIEQLVRDGALSAEKERTTRRSTRSKALPSTITTYKIIKS